MGKVVANQRGAIWDGHNDFAARVRDMVSGLQHGVVLAVLRCAWR